MNILLISHLITRSCSVDTMTSSNNGHVPLQSNGHDPLSTTSLTKKTSPISQLSKEELNRNGGSRTLEMTPMLQTDHHSSIHAASANGTINSKYSPNISIHSKSSSSYPNHHLGNDNSKSSVKNGKLNGPQLDLNCDNKPNTTLYCTRIPPSVKCLTNCCCNELDDSEDATKMTTVHYKVLTLFMSSCVVGLLCFILIMFLSPQLFFKSQGMYAICIL